MPVQDFMSKDLITVDEDASIIKASKLMKQNRVRHLPVLRKGRLLGIVSDLDLKEATPSKATTLDIHEMYYLLDRVKVKSLMPKHLYTIAPGATVEKAAAVMLNRNISALPVVDPTEAWRGSSPKATSSGPLSPFRASPRHPWPWAWSWKTGPARLRRSLTGFGPTAAASPAS